MIKYTNISAEDYYHNFSEEERKEKPYCIEFHNSGKNWVVNGNLHREDGLAVEYSDGIKYWYLNGKQYSFENWLKLTPISDEEKVFLRLKYS